MSEAQTVIKVRQESQHPLRHKASRIRTDTTNFDGSLSGTDTDLQTALDTLDDATGSGDVTSVGDCTGGACLDGSSDGGTNIELYNSGSSNSYYYFEDSAGSSSYFLFDGAQVHLVVNGTTEQIWGTAAAASFLLQEDGSSYILQEDGSSKLVIE